MSSIEARLESLEVRLRAAEDELAIIRLIASYGPLVDSGDADLAPELFATNGVYDVDVAFMTGREAISDLLRGQGHRDCVETGAAHSMGLPWVRVDVDKAIAINVSQLLVCNSEGFEVFRVAQNLWKLERAQDGNWLVRERINRLIGEDSQARDLLLGAI